MCGPASRASRAARGPARRPFARPVPLGVLARRPPDAGRRTRPDRRPAPAPAPAPMPPVPIGPSRMSPARSDPHDHHHRPWRGVLVATALPAPRRPLRRLRRLRRALRLARRRTAATASYRTARSASTRCSPPRSAPRSSRPPSPRSAGDRVMPGRRRLRRPPRPAAGPSRRATPAARAVMLLPPNAYRADERVGRSPTTPRSPQAGAAGRGVQQPASTPRSTSPPSCSPSCTREGLIVGRQGVLRRCPPRLPASPNSPRNSTC